MQTLIQVGRNSADYYRITNEKISGQPAGYYRKYQCQIARISTGFPHNTLSYACAHRWVCPKGGSRTLHWARFPLTRGGYIAHIGVAGIPALSLLGFALIEYVGGGKECLTILDADGTKRNSISHSFLTKVTKNSGQKQVSQSLIHAHPVQKSR